MGLVGSAVPGQHQVPSHRETHIAAGFGLHDVVRGNLHVWCCARNFVEKENAFAFSWEWGCPLRRAVQNGWQSAQVNAFASWEREGFQNLRHRCCGLTYHRCLANARRSLEKDYDAATVLLKKRGESRCDFVET